MILPSDWGTMNWTAAISSIGFMAMGLALGLYRKDRNRRKIVAGIVLVVVSVAMFTYAFQFQVVPSWFKRLGGFAVEVILA